MDRLCGQIKAALWLLSERKCSQSEAGLRLRVASAACEGELRRELADLFPFWLPQGRQRPPHMPACWHCPLQVKLAPRRAHIPPLVVYLCAPRKRGEYVTSIFRFLGSCHSVSPPLSFSALGIAPCGGVVSRFSALILEIVC